MKKFLMPVFFGMVAAGFTPGAQADSNNNKCVQGPVGSVCTCIKDGQILCQTSTGRCNWQSAVEAGADGSIPPLGPQGATYPGAGGAVCSFDGQSSVTTFGNVICEKGKPCTILCVGDGAINRYLTTACRKTSESR